MTGCVNSVRYSQPSQSLHPSRIAYNHSANPLVSLDQAAGNIQGPAGAVPRDTIHLVFPVGRRVIVNGLNEDLVHLRDFRDPAPDLPKA